MVRLIAFLVASLISGASLAQFEYLNKSKSADNRDSEIEFYKSELSRYRDAYEKAVQSVDDGIDVAYKLAADSHSDEKTIYVWVARGFACPPCEKWKREQLPKVLEAGWKVHFEAVSDRMVPQFMLRGVKTTKYLDDLLMVEILSIPQDAREEMGFDSQTASGVFNARSSRWPKVRDEFLKRHPKCEACGRDHNLAVHHVVPFHEHPEWELLEVLPDGRQQFITLCVGDGSPNSNCHLIFGHDPDGKNGPLKPNWKLSNPNVLKDAQDHFRSLKR